MTTGHGDHQGRLVELVSAWGADPMAWPECERSQAALAALAAPGPALSRALAQARELDEMFAALPALDPPAGLAGRILARAPRARGSRAGWMQLPGDLLRPGARFWPPAAGLASLFLGLIIGLQMASPPPGMTAEDQAIYAALGLQDYGALAQGDFE